MRPRDALHWLKVLAMLAASLLWVLCCFRAAHEVWYLVWGRSGVARVVNCYKAKAFRKSPYTAVVYQYDDNGNLVVKTDARSVSTHFAYDSINRVTRRWYNGLNLLTATTHNSPALPAGVELVGISPPSVTVVISPPATPTPSPTA